jgi:hypothetical protein
MYNGKGKTDSSAALRNGNILVRGRHIPGAKEGAEKVNMSSKT